MFSEATFKFEMNCPASLKKTVGGISILFLLVIYVSQCIFVLEVHFWLSVVCYVLNRLVFSCQGWSGCVQKRRERSFQSASMATGHESEEG